MNILARDADSSKDLALSQKTTVYQTADSLLAHSQQGSSLSNTVAADDWSGGIRGNFACRVEILHSYILGEVWSRIKTIPKLC